MGLYSFFLTFAPIIKTTSNKQQQSTIVMTNMRRLLNVCSLALVTAFVVSCQEGVDESDHYQVPDWLKGNAYQVLPQFGIRKFPKKLVI